MKRLFKSLKSYLASKLTFQQESKFRTWLGSKEGKTTFSEYVETTYSENEGNEIHPEWQGDELLKRILEKKRMTNLSIWKVRTLNFSTWIYRIVASLLLLFFLGNAWYGRIQTSGGQDEKPEFVPVLITKQNPKGQKSRIILPDSSVVYLNADSNLSYLQNFAKGREVMLIGEAFFEVKSDSLNPFVVKSPKLSSTALGTSFNVSAYPDQPIETVSLASGKIVVATSQDTQSVVLSPGEGTILKDNFGELTKVSINADLSALWTKGILHFDKVPWSEVIILLERWYGVTIHVTGTWSNPTCSGSFEQNEYLNNVLRVLGHSIGFSHTISGKNVTIHLKS